MYAAFLVLFYLFFLSDVAHKGVTMWDYAVLKFLDARKKECVATAAINFS